MKKYSQHQTKWVKLRVFSPASRASRPIFFTFIQYSAWSLRRLRQNNYEGNANRKGKKIKVPFFLENMTPHTRDSEISTWS